MSIRPILALAFVACGGNSGTHDGPTACSNDQDCAAPTPACDTQAMQCVQCTDVNATACTGETPACAPDHTCHGPCLADADCASAVCRADGTCADPSTVLWVSRDVTGTTCTLADKCTLQTALGLAAAPRDLIHMDPLGYHFAAGFAFDRDLSIVGRGATVTVDTNTVFRVANLHKITLELLTLGGSPPTLPSEGIECTNATLTAKAITIQNTTGIGINASGCFLRLERSTLHDNQLGALLIGGGGIFAIFDDFIYRNGDPATGSAGAIQMLGSVDPASRLEFNTIVDNHASAGATNAGGVICDQDGFSAPNNLIVRNDLAGNTTATNAQTFGACTYPTSIVKGDVTGLAFASPDAQPFDYHISAGSLAIDQATTPSTVVYDHDLDSRPQGAGKDLGADELKP